MKKKTNKILNYIKVGFKLFLVSILGILILFIPQTIALFSVATNPNSWFIYLILAILLSFLVPGWLLSKFKRWIFR